MKKLLAINLLLFTLVGSALVFAQSQGQSTNENGCRRYKMRVTQAPEDVDKSMVIAENNGPQLAKGIVIDPCRNNARVPVRVKPQANKPFQIQPAAPKLPLVTPSPAPKLKTPSEVLRDTLKPKQP